MALAPSLPGVSCARGRKRVSGLAQVVASGYLVGPPEPFRPGRLQARREGCAWMTGGERRLGAPDRAPALFLILSTWFAGVTIVRAPARNTRYVFRALDYSN